jgi:hypothetical protein
MAEKITQNPDNQIEELKNQEITSVLSELAELKKFSPQINETNETQDPPNLKEWFETSKLKDSFEIDEDFSFDKPDQKKLYLEPKYDETGNSNAAYESVVIKWINGEKPYFVLNINNTRRPEDDSLSVDTIFIFTKIDALESKFLEVKNSLETITEGQAEVFEHYFDERDEYKEPYCYIKSDSNWITQNAENPQELSQELYIRGKKFATIGYDTEKQKFFCEIGDTTEWNEKIGSIIQTIDQAAKKNPDYESIIASQKKLKEIKEKTENVIEKIYNYELTLTDDSPDEVFADGINDLSINMTLSKDRLINKAGGEIEIIQDEYWLRSRIISEPNKEPVYKIVSCDGLPESIFENLEIEKISPENFVKLVKAIGEIITITRESDEYQLDSNKEQKAVLLKEKIEFAFNNFLKNMEK